MSALRGDNASFVAHMVICVWSLGWLTGQFFGSKGKVVVIS
jgi:hypothetical protein